MARYQYKLVKVTENNLFNNTSSVESNLNTNYGSAGWKIVNTVNNGTDIMVVFEKQVG